MGQSCQSIRSSFFGRYAVSRLVARECPLSTAIFAALIRRPARRTRTGRLERLTQLDDAAKECMEPTPWRDFLLRVQHAGFVNPALIGSKNAIVNAYAFYIRGRKAGVPKNKLDELIARWVFGTLLTARYSGSSETIFEQDLARVSRLTSRTMGSVSCELSTMR